MAPADEGSYVGPGAVDGSSIGGDWLHDRSYFDRILDGPLRGWVVEGPLRSNTTAVSGEDNGYFLRRLEEATWGAQTIASVGGGAFLTGQGSNGQIVSPTGTVYEVVAKVRFKRHADLTDVCGFGIATRTSTAQHGDTFQLSKTSTNRRRIVVGVDSAGDVKAYACSLTNGLSVTPLLSGYADNTILKVYIKMVVGESAFVQIDDGAQVALPADNVPEWVSGWIYGRGATSTAQVIHADCFGGAWRITGPATGE